MNALKDQICVTCMQTVQIPLVVTNVPAQLDTQGTGLLVVICTIAPFISRAIILL